jgi:hypothetical protein
MSSKSNNKPPKKRKYAASMISNTNAAIILQRKARSKIRTMRNWVEAHRQQVKVINKAYEKRDEYNDGIINQWMFGHTNTTQKVIDDLLNSYGSARNGAGYIYRSLKLSPNNAMSIQIGTSIPHRLASSWTLNPVMAVGWHDPRATQLGLVVILRMKTASNVRKLFIGSYKPPIDVRPHSNPTTTEFANQAEVIVAKTDFIVTRVRLVPIGMLTGVNSTGRNHKHLPNTCGGSLSRHVPGLNIPGYTPNALCNKNRPNPSVLLVDVSPKPLLKH